MKQLERFKILIIISSVQRFKFETTSNLHDDSEPFVSLQRPQNVIEIFDWRCINKSYNTVGKGSFSISVRLSNCHLINNSALMKLKFLLVILLVTQCSE